MLLISRQTALSLFTYTHIKFLSFLTQRLSFCSTNVVKVQVSSILKGKNFDVTKDLNPTCQIGSLPPSGFAASGWFVLSTISKTRLTLPRLISIFSVPSPIISTYFVYASQRIKGRFEIWKQVLTIF